MSRARKMVLSTKRAKKLGEKATSEMVKVSLRVSLDYRTAMKILAAQEGVDMQSLVLDAVADKFPSLPEWRVDDE